MPDNKPMTREENAKHMINEVQIELDLVHQGKYDFERAKRTAALALRAQMEISEFLADLEGRTKKVKYALSFIESEAYFDQKNLTDKKLSEAALQQLIVRDKEVIKTKSDLIEAEVHFKNWEKFFITMKDAHIFFRNLGNGKNDWSM